MPLDPLLWVETLMVDHFVCLNGQVLELEPIFDLGVREAVRSLFSVAQLEDDH